MRLDELSGAVRQLVSEQPPVGESAAWRRVARKRRRTLARRGTIATCVVALLGAVVALPFNADDTPSRVLPFSVAAGGGGRTAQLEEQLRIEVSAGDRSVVLSLAGPTVVDFEQGTSIAVLTVDGAGDGGEAATFERRATPTATYQRFRPSDRAFLGVPTTWVATQNDASDLLDGRGVNLVESQGMLTFGRDPDVERYEPLVDLGTERILGRTTTHYRLTARPQPLRRQLQTRGLRGADAAAIAPVEVIDVWADASGVVRQLQTTREQTLADRSTRVRTVSVQRLVATGGSAPQVIAPPLADTTWLTVGELSRRFASADLIDLLQEGNPDA